MLETIVNRCMEEVKEKLALLKRYLAALDLKQLARIVFCGDGASRIGSRVEALITKLGFDPQRIDQVIDYTHAEQNLRQIGELLPSQLAHRARIYAEWKALLGQGDIAGLCEAINRTLTGKRRRQAQRKWKSYFDKNAARMPYQRFKENHIPCGSGCVESAIRRVINLRLKSAGSFWTRGGGGVFFILAVAVAVGTVDDIHEQCNASQDTRSGKCSRNEYPAKRAESRMNIRRFRSSHFGNAPRKNRKQVPKCLSPFILHPSRSP